MLQSATIIQEFRCPSGYEVVGPLRTGLGPAFASPLIGQRSDTSIESQSFGLKNTDRPVRSSHPCAVRHGFGAALGVEESSH